MDALSACVALLPSNGMNESFPYFIVSHSLKVRELMTVSSTYLSGSRIIIFHTVHCFMSDCHSHGVFREHLKSHCSFYYYYYTIMS